jgi:hypothetical protein
LLDRFSLKKRVSLRLVRLRKVLHVDTQGTREKLIRRLEEIFRIASEYARAGKWVVDEDGKERPLTIVERQFWARIAAHAAQIRGNVAKGIDERQIDKNLDELEAMLSERKAEIRALTNDLKGNISRLRSYSKSGRGEVFPTVWGFFQNNSPFSVSFVDAFVYRLYVCKPQTC